MSLPFFRGAVITVLVMLLPRLAAATAPAPPSPVAARLVTPWADLSPLEAAALALPDARDALAGELSRRGLSATDRDVFLPEVVASLRQLATSGQGGGEPTHAVGPVDLTAAQLRLVVGPREGRSRFEVIQRLRLAAPSPSAGLDASELLALVPMLVQADDRLRAPELLARFGRALFETEDHQ